jgi:hypothetical protein
MIYVLHSLGHSLPQGGLTCPATGCRAEVVLVLWWLLGAAITSSAQMGGYMRAIDQFYYERYMTIVRAGLAPEMVTTAWSEGQTWSPYHIVDTALVN